MLGEHSLKGISRCEQKGQGNKSGHDFIFVCLVCIVMAAGWCNRFEKLMMKSRWEKKERVLIATKEDYGDS